MAQGILVYGFPVSGDPPTIGGGPIIPPSGPVDPGYGQPGPGKPPGLPPTVGGGPIYPPHFPGVWPPPGQVAPPIHIPPGGIAMPPIYIPEDPQKPIQLPPGTIWPPLPPDAGVNGKVIILIWVLGVGWRWLVYEGPSVPGTPGPK